MGSGEIARITPLLPIANARLLADTTRTAAMAASLEQESRPVATSRKSGRNWKARIRIGMPERIRTSKSKRLARQSARGAAEDGVDQGLVADRQAAARTSLGQILERYRREVTPAKRGATDEDFRLRAMARRSIARVRMAQLTSSRIAAYRDERLKVVRGATVNRELNLLSHAIDIARREWDLYVPLNPCTLVRHAPTARPRSRRLQGDEEHRLLTQCRAARNPWLAHFVSLAVATGMRRGELLSLQWANVDLEKRTAFLPITKNGEARRVPLSSQALAIFQGLPSSCNGRVFGNLTVGGLKKSFKRAVRRAHIEDLRLHDLRHEATSRFFEKGLNMMEVAFVTGHKTLQMLKRYTHLSATDLAARLG
jgi:integrase